MAHRAGATFVRRETRRRVFSSNRLRAITLRRGRTGDSGICRGGVRAPAMTVGPSPRAGDVADGTRMAGAR